VPAAAVVRGQQQGREEGDVAWALYEQGPAGAVNDDLVIPKPEVSSRRGGGQIAGGLVEAHPSVGGAGRALDVDGIRVETAGVGVALALHDPDGFVRGLPGRVDAEVAALVGGTPAGKWLWNQVF
jgi:hypothetical protein